MKFDVEEFKKKAREDFEHAWHEGPSVLTPPGVSGRYPRLKYTRATPHPIFEIVQRLRETYLSMGFDEAMNPLIVEESDIYRQFGPEAMAVLDRVFYLGGLPRPNVGIAKKQIEEIEAILGRAVSPATEENLRVTLHGYKKGTIDGDDLAHELAGVLEADDATVVHILDAVFPEFRALAPESSRNTLRSHMTSGWFLTLSSLWERRHLPIRLFSVDRCFRREQEEGPTRLMAYHSASCVVAGEDVTLEEGKAVSEALLSAFGFTEFRFQPDEKRSKYYMPDTQTEVYARHPVLGWVEVATFGIYSPSALAEYGIGVPVMNLGLGVERLAMIAYQSNDIRELTYPQFFPQEITDREIAGAVHLREEPASATGKRMAEAIRATAAEHAAAPGPCAFTAWKGEVAGRTVEVVVEEPESNTKLCGPAYANEVFVHNGSVLGVPDIEKWALVRREGVSTGITYLDAAANLAAARIEEAARCGEETRVQVKMAKLPSDINLRIEEYAMRYVTDHNRKVDLRGPVFLTVRSVIPEPQI
ncbi:MULTISPECIES: O-phosphoserine--tRNA ligase [unclassified Methanoculleus]|jgi:O-phosphoseryl-tRNA synthetase|uniref:O-phosphoserine--tRNA(Cys) ligase n=1 Tax=Methanoculleus palmolei TaxID=72612 RepID=A0ABD8A9L2_9EURY|nr:O-phosphoserine--tRNA ligase [Methanoculleus sp. UBA377]WOX56202.1 O-phosphoserine--tRNA ligase [Methanoculleus palmolei]